MPWHGLLLSYALTQVTGSLHLPPGNLGIVEASLSALLVAYGLHPEQAIAATEDQLHRYPLADPDDVGAVAAVHGHLDPLHSALQSRGARPARTEEEPAQPIMPTPYQPGRPLFGADQFGPRIMRPVSHTATSTALPFAAGAPHRELCALQEAGAVL